MGCLKGRKLQGKVEDMLKKKKKRSNHMLDMSIPTVFTGWGIFIYFPFFSSCQSPVKTETMFKKMTFFLSDPVQGGRVEEWVFCTLCSFQSPFLSDSADINVLSLV